MGIILGVISVVGVAIGVVADEEDDVDELEKKPDPEPIIPSPSIPEPIDQIIPLNSEVGVDYRRLQELLAAKQYQQANRETFRVMSQAAFQTDDGWFEEVNIAQFPCTDLRTINQLWLHYSGGHFGFSVQKEVYNQVEGNYEQLAQTVGWLEENGWQDYVDLRNEKLVPRGYLPSMFASQTTAWFSRASNCGF